MAWSRPVSDDRATLAGFLDGDAGGGARMVAMRGLGARFLAGEKCCWRVEKAGRW